MANKYLVQCVRAMPNLPHIMQIIDQVAYRWKDMGKKWTRPVTTYEQHTKTVCAMYIPYYHHTKRTCRLTLNGLLTSAVVSLLPATWSLWGSCDTQSERPLGGLTEVRTHWCRLIAVWSGSTGTLRLLISSCSVSWWGVRRLQKSQHSVDLVCVEGIEMENTDAWRYRANRTVA